jgi:hypothetical protein
VIRTAAFLLSLLLFSAVAGAQEKDGEKKDSEKKKLKLDLDYKYDPFELHAYSRRFPRPKRLKGPLVLGEYSLPPAQDTGPYLGPPLKLYGTGFGASVWRDPVTGRPIL